MGFDCFFFQDIPEITKYTELLADPFANGLPHFHMTSRLSRYQHILNLRDLYGKKGFEMVKLIDEALTKVDPLQGLGDHQFQAPTEGNFHYSLRKLRRMATKHSLYVFYGN